VGDIANTFDYRSTSSRIAVDCGVDLRLVDPSTGQVLASNFGEYQRSDSIGAFGVSVLGFGTRADGDLEISEDSQGKILRLALDDCVRKMLPKVDRALAARTPAAAPMQTPAAPGGAGGSAEPAATKFCSSCGTKLAATAKFCTGCGTAQQ
jgi:hypothetical protein